MTTDSAETSATSAPPAPVHRSVKELLEEHRAARARRASAPLGSDAYLEAAEEIARIEVEIARIGHEASPPTV